MSGKGENGSFRFAIWDILRESFPILSSVLSSLFPKEFPTGKPLKAAPGQWRGQSHQSDLRRCRVSTFRRSAQQHVQATSCHQLPICNSLNLTNTHHKIHKDSARHKSKSTLQLDSLEARSAFVTFMSNSIGSLGISATRNGRTWHAKRFIMIQIRWMLEKHGWTKGMEPWLWGLCPWRS